MNDRLYVRSDKKVNDRNRLVAVFLRDFAAQDDLVALSAAARRILATAAALFHERGAVDTSVRDVTGACGLSPGALYNHFGSKDDLLYTLVRHGHDRMLRRIDAMTPAGTDGDPVAGVRGFVRAYVLGHLEHPEFAQMVRREYLHLSSARRTEIIELRRAVRARLADLLRAGARAGRFDLIDGPDGAVAQALMVLDLCSRTSDWFDRDRGEDVGALADRYELAALRLVGAAP